MISDSSRGSTEAVGPMEVLAFWRAAGPDKWFEKDTAFDSEIAARFSCLWQAGRNGKLAHWGGDAGGCARAPHRARPVPAQHVPRRPARL
jgi:uncharacterized protein (DUF924 family)